MEGNMDWKKYFEEHRGTGYLATAGKDGAVDIAVYSRPRIQDESTLVFGMTDRLTHANLKENKYAAYAFNESGFSGVRIFLEKIREEAEGPVLEAIKERARSVSVPGAGDAIKFAVYFRIIKSLPLVGT
jgi:hypothetical protein